MNASSGKRKIMQIISRGIIYALVFSLVCPQQAWSARSKAGGGKLAEPDWGEVAKNIGITIGTAALGSYLSNSFGSAWQTANPALTQGAQSTNLLTKTGNFFTNLPKNLGGAFKATGELITNPEHLQKGFSSLDSLGKVAETVAKGYTTVATTRQVTRAIGMVGTYYEWSPKKTFAISSLAVGATGGFLNPEAVLGETFSPAMSGGSAMLRGVLVGGLSGWARAAAIGAIDGDKINKGKSPGITAQIAGMAASIYATELGKTLLDARTYNIKWEKLTQKTGPQTWTRGPAPGGEWRLVVDENAFGREKSFWARNGVQLETEEAPLPNRYEKSDGTYITEDGLREMTGLPQFEKNLQRAKLLLKDSQLSLNGGIEAMQRSETWPYLGGIKGEQLDFAYNVKPGPSEDTLYLPLGGKPTDSQILDRIFLRPLAETVNHWPLLATRYLALVITRKYEDSNKGGQGEKWSPLIEEAIYSVASPLLDNAATIWNLKIDLDEKLGYYPEIKYQREQLVKRAMVERVFEKLPKSTTLKPVEENRTIIGYQDPVTKNQFSCQEIEELKSRDLVVEENGQLKLFRPTMQEDNALFALADTRGAGYEFYPTGEQSYRQGPPRPQEIPLEAIRVLEKVGSVERFGDTVLLSPPDVTQLELTENFSAEEKEEIRNKYNRAKAISLLNKEPFTESDRAKVLSQAVVEAATATGGSNLEILQKIRGSKWGIFSTTAKNVFFSELPIALISGSIEVGMDDSLAGESSRGAMRASLRNVAAASVIRGIIWHNYGQDTFRRQIAGIMNHDDNPLEVFPYRPLSEADIISARIRRDLPLVDNQRYRAEIKYRYKDEASNVSPKSAAEVQGIINELSSAYKIPQEEIDLAKVDLDKIRSTINEGMQKEGIIEGVNPDTWEYLKKVEQIVTRVKADDEQGPYHLGAGVLANPIAGTEGFYTPEKDMRKSRLAPESKMVFGVEGDKPIILSQQEAEKYRTKEFTIHNNEIVPMGKYEIPGKNIWGPYPVSEPPELMSTIVGSLGQSSFEFGWQSLAMGLPYTPQGKMGTYAWVNYLQTLEQLSSAAATAGVFEVMTQYATSTGVAQNFGVSKGLVSRNVLTTIADTPVGDWLGMAPFIPVSGYRGMPFSVAANIGTGYKTTETKYYPYWPYQRINMVAHDPFWRNVKAGMTHKLTGQVYMPGNGEKPLQSSIEPINLEKNIK